MYYWNGIKSTVRSGGQGAGGRGIDGIIEGQWRLKRELAIGGRERGRER